MSEVIDVALCDDHTIVRSGLRRILEGEDDVNVVGEAGTAGDVITLAAETRPDVLVLDLGLPDRSGIEAMKDLLAASPDTRVLVLTMHDDLGYLRQAFAAGAAGYLLKEAADVELVQAVRLVASGQRYVHPSLGAALVDHDPEAPRPRGPGGELSPREAEVLALIAAGLTNTEIGERLYVSVRTVETHRAHIHQKLDVKSRAELVRIALEAGLLSDGS